MRGIVGSGRPFFPTRRPKLALLLLMICENAVQGPNQSCDLFGRMPGRKSQPKPRRSSAYAGETNRRNEETILLKLACALQSCVFFSHNQWDDRTGKSFDGLKLGVSFGRLKMAV
jgi:hypothetical protein